MNKITLQGGFFDGREVPINDGCCVICLPLMAADNVTLSVKYNSNGNYMGSEFVEPDQFYLADRMVWNNYKKTKWELLI